MCISLNFEALEIESKWGTIAREKSTEKNAPAPSPKSETRTQLAPAAAAAEHQTRTEMYCPTIWLVLALRKNMTGL